MEYQMQPFLLSVLLSALLVAACGGDSDAGGKIRVVATTTQIGDFARQVGGDHISLTVLLKPNQDAHDFEPEPSQLRAISQADLVLRNGVGLDTYVNKAVATGSATVFIVTDEIQLREAFEEGEPSDEEDGRPRRSRRPRPSRLVRRRQCQKDGRQHP
jgi:zinc/manganese transport system substrate-binding protein/manganese/iron transport system substrate-binding protein